MASKTEMYKLLRLIDQGANGDNVVRAAWACWIELPEDTRQAMIAGAWDGGQEHILDHVDELEAHVRNLAGGVARAIASLECGCMSEALADLREVL
jgi:hypothetical protein